MYNLNGKKILNSNYTYTMSGGNITTIKIAAISATNSLVDYQGNTVSTAHFIYSSATDPALLMMNIIPKIHLAGFPTNFHVVNANSMSYSTEYYLRLYVEIGHRTTAFNQNTTSNMETNYNTLLSFSVSNGILTITCSNTTDTAITINEVDFWIVTSPSSGNYNRILIAGFNLGEVTIAPNESYSFTVTNI